MKQIYDKLGGDARRLETKRAAPLRLDFYAPELDLYIELDETQHFTRERAYTLEVCGEGVPDDQRNEYLSLISEWGPRAERYRASKPAADFAFAGGRRAQRAYFDVVRDLALPQLGARLVRIPAPECDPDLAITRLERLLRASP